MSPNLRSDPWPHLVLDEVLPSYDLLAARRDFQDRSSGLQISERGAGAITYVTCFSVGIWNYFLSDSFQGQVEAAFGRRFRLRSDSLLQYRVSYPADPGFGKHSDFVDEVTLVTILYISDGWKPSSGGELALYFDGDGDGDKPAIKIEPIGNRLVTFLTEENHLHSVAPLGDWTRVSVLGEWMVSSKS